MGTESKIQWTESTWNPWHGCRKVSTGCKYCYMFRDKEKYGQDGKNVQRSKTKFNAPLKWEDGRMIFTCSWSDWFIEEADEWRDEAWKIIQDTPQHTYQILTKRPERIFQSIPEEWHFLGWPKNIWLGVSCEDQDQFDGRWPVIEQYKVTRFLSLEPLLGPIDLTDWLEEMDLGDEDSSKLVTPPDWVIIGGESGNDKGKYRYRSCQLDWIKHILIDCNVYEVPVFMKQLGTHLSKELGLKDRHGGNWDEWPEHLKVREFPNTLTAASVAS